ncbi:intraflagellar transport protein 25 homolog isoform X2 [Moschus berezovskii]|uniref:intraflagellar transport protein 25 homolog isoform X2 n=1 Tax=Moschus berezovskii TaxID=68408 RepID=UPI002443FA1E|nr:intraflagellar transport protein 25 homolog isoform X2 [Moschus berezovskii]
MDITRWSIPKSDYILCSQRWRSSIQSAKIRPGADRGSDHELLIDKFRLKLKKVGKTTRPFRNPETFWTTTGMFPQEFIICFHKHVKIEKLIIRSYFVRTLRIEKSTSKEPVDFEQWIERDLVHTEGQLQNEEILARDGHVTYLRFIIVSAFDHFASVHSVSAEGIAVSNLS